MNPNSAFGLNVAFDNEQFRNYIKATMQIGTNPNADRRPIFLKKGTGRTYWRDGAQLPAPPRMDRDGRPLDPEIEVRTTPDTRITDADCAVEVTRADAEELPVGNFRPTKCTVTLLDVDYEKVKDCRELIYNGDNYMLGYEPESYGLFEVGVYTMLFYALDES